MARILPYFVFAALCVLAAGLLPAPVARAQAGATDAARDAGIRLLGAARGYATAAIWLRAGDAYARGDLHETRAMYQIIRELQPRNPAVYSFQAWNEGYNLSAQFPEVERRAEWVSRGLNTLHAGQRLLPNEASLRLDEWHYMLGRTQSYPIEVLKDQAAHFGGQDRDWADICTTIGRLEANLKPAERKALREFLDEVGLRPEMSIDFGELKAFAPEYKADGSVVSVEITEFAALPESARGALALAGWARWHCMVMILHPIVHLSPRSASTDKALMLSYYVAQKTLPPPLSDKYTQEYREGVNKAFKAGAENARRVGGEKALQDFIETQRKNFADLPGWLE